jgi:hypothetical protein
VFGVANGTACRMVCMAWDRDEDRQAALAAVETHTELGGICDLPMPPDHVIVSVRAIFVRAWPAHLNLAPRDEKGVACELHIPFGHMSRGKSRRVMVSNLPVAYELLAVDLAFSITTSSISASRVRAARA